MTPETNVVIWEWYYIALYFFVGGVSAGAYFIGSLVELVGSEKHREVSKIAFYIAFPVILLAPILLIADLGRPERFWHLFFYVNGSAPAFNFISPMSVGSWALMVFGAMSLLSFLDNLVQDGYLKFAPFANVYNRIPRKLYALIGSLAGFFVAGYTGVLIDLTARPMWAAMDPMIGFLFLVSAGSTGAASIALVMALRRMLASDTFERLETFDNLAMLVELAVILVIVLIAGQFLAPLYSGTYAILFWGGTILLGILVPLALNFWMRRSAGAPARLRQWVVLASLLILLGGALLRISLITAGQA